MKTVLAPRWTVSDLELMPDNGTRYEIIDGELFMSRQPHWHHQETCVKIATPLNEWSTQTGLGHVSFAPGIIFSDEDAVAPDVVWISRERFESRMDEAGHLIGAPELVVEVLSPGLLNERRDREAKLKLYALRGVLEYWIADWRLKTVEVYRRQEAMLRLVGTMLEPDDLTSPLLPGFRCRVATLFPL